jgi:hypothetical protein
VVNVHGRGLIVAFAVPLVVRLIEAGETELQPSATVLLNPLMEPSVGKVRFRLTESVDR